MQVSCRSGIRSELMFEEVEGEKATLGLGIFTERTIPDYQWNTDEVSIIW